MGSDFVPSLLADRRFYSRSHVAALFAVGEDSLDGLVESEDFDHATLVFKQQLNDVELPFVGRLVAEGTVLIFQLLVAVDTTFVVEYFALLYGAGDNGVGKLQQGEILLDLDDALGGVEVRKVLVFDVRPV